MYVFRSDYSRKTKQNKNMVFFKTVHKQLFEIWKYIFLQMFGLVSALRHSTEISSREKRCSALSELQ